MEAAVFHEIDPNEVRLLRRISAPERGSFGEVWEAAIHHNVVAVKIPRAEQMTEDHLLDWKREMEIMR